MRGGRKDVLFRFASRRRPARADEGFGKVTESVENVRGDGMVFQALCVSKMIFPPESGSARMRCQ
jgi:hypothetical protein